jgi:hypothetical protein
MLPANVDAAFTCTLIFIIICAAIPASTYACSRANPERCTDCRSCLSITLTGSFANVWYQDWSDTRSAPPETLSCGAASGTFFGCVGAGSQFSLVSRQYQGCIYATSSDSLSIPIAELCASCRKVRCRADSAPAAAASESALPGGIIAVVVIIPLLSLINMIAIGFFARRKGLNGAQIAVCVTLAFFFNVFAWICVLLDKKHKITITVSDVIPLAPCSGSPAQNSYDNNTSIPHPTAGAVHAPQGFEAHSEAPAPHPAAS